MNLRMDICRRNEKMSSFFSPTVLVMHSFYIKNANKQGCLNIYKSLYFYFTLTSFFLPTEPQFELEPFNLKKKKCISKIRGHSTLTGRNINNDPHVSLCICDMNLKETLSKFLTLSKIYIFLLKIESNFFPILCCFSSMYVLCFGYFYVILLL